MYEILWNSVQLLKRSCADELFKTAYLIMTKLLSLQGANIQEKLVNQNILVIRTSTHYVTIVYNVYEIFVQWFKRNCSVMQGIFNNGQNSQFKRGKNSN